MRHQVVLNSNGLVRRRVRGNPVLANQGEDGRIYDFDGNVLWEWWHAGVLSSSSIYWHEGRGQIIFGGMYGHHSIEELGYTIPVEFSGQKWPKVVGAITPVFGARIFPNWESPAPSDLTAHTDWYKVLLPLDRAWEYSIFEITLPDQPSLREALVKIVFHTIHEDMTGGGLHWLIDKNGEIVGDTVLSDQFKSAHPDDPEGYLRLGELDVWR